ncbi:stalk domain-containing protein [Paenibacillus sp. FSL H7-0331]|uniref:stalk domain-containing protein n=1 Tax=Paenibacillus sp. FSL H7-0331 TaxID=1920421 RepID=UPI00096C2CA8|nr:stalk domain-containing protein [Paenibacillus sp. FSL H7-0331]OMF18458.1 hypothetical protein BK127_11890 [Paenibacillus sp. FSL H7-0331]
MKNFIVGMSCGILISITTATYAAESIKEASNFPVKFDFNGLARELEEGYTVLNYNGHAYAPVRFIAENLGANIDYDAENEKVVIKNGNLDLFDMNLSGASGGNLVVTKDGTRTKVTGQLKIENLPEEKNTVEGSLYFYNNNNEKIGEAIIKGDHFGKQIQNFTAFGEGYFANYSSAKMEINSINGRRVGENANADDTSIPLIQILDDPLKDISKIEITYGPGRRLVVNNAEVMRTIESKLKEIQLSKLLNQDKRVGYLYFMDIYTGEKKVRYSSELQLNGIMYQHTALTDSLDSFILALER